MTISTLRLNWILVVLACGDRKAMNMSLVACWKAAVDVLRPSFWCAYLASRDSHHVLYVIMLRSFKLSLFVKRYIRRHGIFEHALALHAAERRSRYSETWFSKSKDEGPAEPYAALEPLR
jgi:hypothetical protein